MKNHVERLKRTIGGDKTTMTKFARKPPIRISRAQFFLITHLLEFKKEPSLEYVPAAAH